jgi:F-type H+-transporting ATPase subunit alpha
LSIGDRQTGKTSIAVDTIINQKNRRCCLFMLVLVKSFNNAQVINVSLKKKQAMSYTIVVAECK